MYRTVHEEKCEERLCIEAILYTVDTVIDLMVHYDSEDYDIHLTHGTYVH